MMPVWVFHLGDVTEYEQMPEASLCPEGSLLYDPHDSTFPHSPWWEAYTNSWVMFRNDKVPIEYKTMALLLI